MSRRRTLLGILAASLVFLVLVDLALGASRDAGRSTPSTHHRSLSREFVVSPLVTAKVRSFVASASDLERSDVLGRVVVPLVVLLLVEAELLIAGGRRGGRAVRAFAIPLVTLFLLLALVRLKAYSG